MDNNYNIRNNNLTFNDLNRMEESEFIKVNSNMFYSKLAELGRLKTLNESDETKIKILLAVHHENKIKVDSMYLRMSVKDAKLCFQQIVRQNAFKLCVE